MNTPATNLAPPASTAPAELARAALRHLALRRLPPTPDQYSLAWREVGGSMPASLADVPAAVQVPDIGPLITELLRQLEVTHRHWTSARKKEALGRVLAVHGADPGALIERLHRLIDSWRESPADAPVVGLAPEPATDAPVTTGHTPGPTGHESVQTAQAADPASGAAADLPEPVSEPESVAIAVSEPGAAASENTDVAAPAQPPAVVPVSDARTPSLERVLADMTDLLVAVCETVPTLVEEEAWVRQQFDTIRAMLHPAEGLPDRRDLAHARALLRRTANEHQRLLKMRRRR